MGASPTTATRERQPTRRSGLPAKQIVVARPWASNARRSAPPGPRTVQQGPLVGTEVRRLPSFPRQCAGSASLIGWPAPWPACEGDHGRVTGQGPRQRLESVWHLTVWASSAHPPAWNSNPDGEGHRLEPGWWCKPWRSTRHCSAWRVSPDGDGASLEASAWCKPWCSTHRPSAVLCRGRVSEGARCGKRETGTPEPVV